MLYIVYICIRFAEFFKLQELLTVALFRTQKNYQKVVLKISKQVGENSAKKGRSYSKCAN
jgi:hypothetical protein